MTARYPLPYAFARAFQLLLESNGEHFTLWHTGKPALGAWGEVMRKFEVRHIEAAEPAWLAQRISAAYAEGESSAATVVSEVEKDADLSQMLQELPAVEDLLATSDDAPIIRLLNALLTQAVRDGASDIHIEPYEQHSAVRFRVDGTLREVVQPNRALHAALISRLKIMADLDIAEKRLPQDGRISLRIGTRAVDVRVSTLPNRMASAPCCACWTKAAASSRWPLSAWKARPCSASTNCWVNRTASCWSRGRRARARPPRCTQRSVSSTPRSATS